MPFYTRWSLRFSFIYLLLTWFLEILRQSHILLGIPSILYFQYVGIIHLFFVGWLTQMIFGVAYWLFPTKNRESPRGYEPFNTASLYLLNIGLLMRLFFEPLLQFHYQHYLRWIYLTSSVFQLLAILFFSYNIWGRIRDKGIKKKVKEKQSDKIIQEEPLSVQGVKKQNDASS